MHNDTKTKTPSQSAIETVYLVMPHQANPQGTAFGGVIMSWIDMIAALSAQKHCRRQVVTAGIDSISFREPIHIGDHVILKACVNYVSRTSMEVGVRVIREDPYSNKQVIATTAHMTFVALDDNNKPCPVDPVFPQTPEEKRRYENAKLRVKTRKELISKIKQSQ